MTLEPGRRGSMAKNPVLFTASKVFCGVTWANLCSGSSCWMAWPSVFCAQPCQIAHNITVKSATNTYPLLDDLAALQVHVEHWAWVVGVQHQQRSIGLVQHDLLGREYLLGARVLDVFDRRDKVQLAVFLLEHPDTRASYDKRTIGFEPTRAKWAFFHRSKALVHSYPTAKELFLAPCESSSRATSSSSSKLSSSSSSSNSIWSSSLIPSSSSIFTLSS